MNFDLMILPRITKIKHSVEPTWASDAGRNSNIGDFSGTFVGYFDNLNITVGTTTQEELTKIRSYIEVPIIENVSFLDTKTGKNKIESFYGTAIEVEINKRTRRYPSFSFSLKAIERRDDM